MNMNKSVKAVLPATEIDMGGFPVKQALPKQQFAQLDPFLLVHHGHAKYSNRRPAKQQGIGPHPHRGFSPVTFVIEGAVHHRDSRGNSQVAKEGEVQWMNAGAGIIHSERPSEEIADARGRQEIVQVWINTPASKKMLPPKYYHLPENVISILKSIDGKVKTKLIAGDYKALNGKIPTQSDMLVLWSKGEKEGFEKFDISSEFNTMLYVVRGSISIKGYGLVDAENLVIFNMEGNVLEMHLREDETEVLILSGAPLNEKVTKNGPFVMNTETEILEAMRDYQMGKMGILIEQD
jgi:redox-sensitive bicupin YhaK (pirin superfamily)